MFSGGDDAHFTLRYHHIVYAHRYTGAGGIIETGIHQAVGEYHSGFETNAAITGIDQAGDGLLSHILINEVEG